MPSTRAPLIKKPVVVHRKDGRTFGSTRLVVSSKPVKLKRRIARPPIEPPQPRTRNATDDGDARSSRDLTQEKIDAHAADYADNGCESAAFVSWFGDWMHDPKSASKVIKKSGEPEETYEADVTHPSVVYHGTTQKFSAFDPKKQSDEGFMGPGFYFTEDSRLAREYSSDDGEVHACYLNIRNPFDCDAPVTHGTLAKIKGILIGKKVASSQDDDKETKYNGHQLIGVLLKSNDKAGVSKILKKAGFDGICYQGDHGKSESKVWVTFHPTQAKHILNRGTFHPDEHDIFKSHVDRAVAHYDAAVRRWADVYTEHRQGNSQPARLARLSDVCQRSYRRAQDLMAQVGGQRLHPGAGNLSKAQPLKNKPGLHLDSVKHRWTRDLGKPKVAVGPTYYHGTNDLDGIRKHGFRLDAKSAEGSSYVGDNIFHGVHLSKDKSAYEPGGQLEDVKHVVPVKTTAHKILKTDFDGISKLHRMAGVNETDEDAPQQMSKFLQENGYHGISYHDETVIFNPEHVHLKEKGKAKPQSLAERAHMEAENWSPPEKLLRGIDRSDAIALTVPTMALSVSRQAMAGTGRDVSSGAGSHSSGKPISVVYDTHAHQFLVADGYHRLWEAISRGETKIKAKVWSGYSDYSSVSDSERFNMAPLYDQVEKKRTLTKAHATGYPLQGRRVFRGLEISVENRAGSYRVDKQNTPPKWANLMLVDYGYIRFTEGTDHDHVDVFVGDNQEAPYVYIVHQVDPKTGKYDEDKCMLGFNSAAEAKAMYLAHYDTPKFFGSMQKMPFEEFKAKVLATLKQPGIVKALSPAQQKEIDAETARIKLSAEKPSSKKPHRFKPAKWTHPNGHPRCRICGDEEPVGGRCNMPQSWYVKQARHEEVAKFHADVKRKIGQDSPLKKATLMGKLVAQNRPRHLQGGQGPSHAGGHYVGGAAGKPQPTPEQHHAARLRKGAKNIGMKYCHSIKNSDNLIPVHCFEHPSPRSAAENLSNYMRGFGYETSFKPGQHGVVVKSKHPKTGHTQLSMVSGVGRWSRKQQNKPSGN